MNTIYCDEDRSSDEEEESEIDECDREALRNPLYNTMLNSAFTFIYNKRLLSYTGHDGNYNYAKDIKLKCTDTNIRYDIKQYIKLLLTYDKYNKLHMLKNKTKLNNDIIFNIIIKYMP